MVNKIEINPHTYFILKKHMLDFEKSMRFVHDNLRDVNALSRAVLNKIDFKHGNFYTLLPDDADFERIYDFEGGEIIPQPQESSVFHIRSAGDFLGVSVISIKKDVAHFICNFLAENKNYLALFDNCTSRPSDPHVYLENTRLLLRDEEVYYLLDETNSESEILKAIGRCDALWHGLIVVFKNTTNLIPDIPSEKNFETLCQNVRYVIVPCYDGEGFVFWERLQDTIEAQ